MTVAGVGPSVGEYTTFVLMAMRLIFPLLIFGMLINQIQQSEASALRINEIFDTTPTVFDQAQAMALDGHLEHVHVRDLSFAYPERKRVLCGINLHLECGRMLGVVGPTGAGKSSLAKLMLRYYDPAAGEILVNNLPLSSISLDSWRGRIGYVSQEAYLFHGTVAENIRLGSPGAPDEAVEEAARMAGADEFIAKLPQGYATMVGDRGMKLGRPAPAHLPGQGHPARSRIPDPGRGHGQCGHAHRRGHPEQPPLPAPKPHHPGHCPSVVHGTALRRDRGHCGRGHRGARHPRGTGCFGRGLRGLVAGAEWRLGMEKGRVVPASRFQRMCDQRRLPVDCLLAPLASGVMAP